MMAMSDYPKLVFHLDGIRQNASAVVEFCTRSGVDVCAVTKGVCADPRVVEAMLEGGCSCVADSRLRNLKNLKASFPDVERTLLRVPMRSELAEAVESVSCSLVSMTESIEALEAECRLQKTTHKALLMFDLGDRREGILQDELEEFVRAFKKYSRVRLWGVGVNFGCFAGVLPSTASLERLCRNKEILERELGYEVPVCSGGATSSLMLLERGELPKGVNQLRVGEAVLLGLDVTWQRKIPWLRQDTAYLDAELVELRVKPSLPHGETGADAFGKVRVFEDAGDRLRGIVAVGRQDADPEGLAACDPDVKILGGSSDHTLLDFTEVKNPPQWGDTVRFALDYGALLGLSTSPYVAKEYLR